MSKGAVIFIILGLIIILKPEIIAYVLGLLLLTIGGTIIYAQFKVKNSTSGKAKDNDYFRFGEYKIYKNK